MKRLEITQTELATHVNVKPNTVTQWLAGRVDSKRLDMLIPAFLDGVELGQKRLTEAMEAA